MPFEQLSPEAKIIARSRYPLAGPGDGFRYLVDQDGHTFGRFEDGKASVQDLFEAIFPGVSRAAA